MRRGEKMKSKLKKINLEDNLAQMFLLCVGVYVGLTGFLLFDIDGSIRIGSIYTVMSRLMSLDAWALLLLLSGVIMIISAFQAGRVKAFSMAISGTLGGILLMLYGLASFEVSSTYAVGMRYVTVGSFLWIISFLGIRTLWIERRVRHD